MIGVQGVFAAQPAHPPGGAQGAVVVVFPCTARKQKVNPNKPYIVVVYGNSGHRFDILILLAHLNTKILSDKIEMTMFSTSC